MSAIRFTNKTVFSEWTDPESSREVVATSCERSWSEDEQVLFDWCDVTTHVQQTEEVNADINMYEDLSLAVEGRQQSSDTVVEMNGVLYPVDIGTDLGNLSGSQTRDTKVEHQTCRLWKFMLDLLSNPKYNPEVIKWSNQDKGEFILVKSREIAKMWGIRKNNNGMTYEKLSRALRYYYKTKVLLPVLGKRLMYKFGPSSYGWQ